MGLSLVTISHKKNQEVKPRGYHGLPKLGRELIEDGLIWLCRRFNKDKVTPVFATFTLPTTYQDGSAIGPEDHHQLLVNWPEIVRQFFQELMRENGRLSLPERFIYVVEPQEDRWKNHGVFAPHIHAVIPNRWVKGGWLLRYEATDGIWGRILSNVLGREVNICSACNLQPVHGMSKLQDYLSKFNRTGRYLSKGSKFLAEIRSTGVPLPKSWYGSDQDTKQTVRDTVVKGQVDNVDVSWLSEAIEHVEFTLGRSIFTQPFLVEKEGIDWVVSAVTKVRNLADVEQALEMILPLLVDTS